MVIENITYPSYTYIQLVCSAQIFVARYSRVDGKSVQPNSTTCLHIEVIDTYVTYVLAEAKLLGFQYC